jgi:hypothetical protein
MSLRHSIVAGTVTAIAAFVAMPVMAPAPAGGTIIYVDDDNCPGPGSGTEMDPYCSIQTAIENAMDGYEIIVAPGTYFENINLLGKVITVRSLEGAELTKIQPEDPLVSIVTCDSGEGPDTVLEGFSIRAGGAAWGAGMRNESSSPTLRRCIFEFNVADGGFYAPGCEIFSCCPLGFPAPLGGGMFNHNSNPILIESLFRQNHAPALVGLCGGEPCCSYNPDCCPYNVYITGEGGAIFGGGTLINCTLVDNSAGSFLGVGGAIYGGATLINCVVWNNGPDPLYATGFVSYSDVQGGWPGTGNIDVDPLFVAPDNGDFRLSPGSPCIDAGDNTAVPEYITTDLDGNPRFVDDPDTEDTGNGDPPIVDMGPYEFQGIPCPGDTDGDGEVGIFDLLNVLISWILGCPPPPPFACGDVDGDGEVTVEDLLTVLNNWGPCPE